MAQVRVHKRGKTFSYIFEAGKVDGKRKVVEKGGFQTKAAAYKAGVEAYNDFIHGNIGITSEAVTLKEFMMNWLDNVVTFNVKPTSFQTYSARFKDNIAPYLSDKKVQDLTPAMLDEWLRKLLQGGLAQKTLSVIHARIHNALKYAVYPAQMINSNPADYIKVPKNAPKNIVKRTIVTPERFKDLLEKYPFGTCYYIPLLLLYHTGMRLGEVLGLAWTDVNFAEKKITLRRQIIHLSGKGYFFSTLKIESSNCCIIIDNFLLDKLRRWKDQQAENEKEFGDSYVYIYREENGHIQRQSKYLSAPAGEKISLICTHNDGRLIVRSRFMGLLEQERLNAHSFRHTHATQLIGICSCRATKRRRPQWCCRASGAFQNQYHSRLIYTQYYKITRKKQPRFLLKICRQSSFADKTHTMEY